MGWCSPSGLWLCGGGQEIAGDQLGALVDQLVEGMLPVGAGLAPDHRAGGVVHPLALRG